MRHLTDTESFRTVKVLREMYKYADDQDNNKIDVKLIPYLRRLNKVVGVATVKSCVGHGDDGYLLLRASRSISNIFYEKAFNLVKVAGVLKVSILYTTGEEELIEIWFDSIETESGRKTIERIIIFFELLKCY